MLYQCVVSAQKIIAVADTKLKLHSHADTCVLGNYYLISHDHNRPVNINGYNPKAGLKHK